MITYRLSNRQRKELRIRGVGLVIAIPEPWDGDEDDALAFARAALPEDSEEIASAEWDDIPVELPAGGPGLAGVLGAILPPDPPPCLHLVVRVALVRLRARNERHCHSAPQWPGVAISGEMRWPKEDE